MANCDVNELVTKCRSFKILPSLEHILQQMGFNVELDAQTMSWLHQLKVTWKTWKRNATIESHVDRFFRSRPDAFRIAILFIIKCDEFKDCKPKSLPFFIMEVLLKYAQANQVYAEDSLKKPAFQVAAHQRNQHFFTLMVKAYNLVSIKEYVVPIVDDMIKSDNCRQASQIVIAMELFKEVPVERLLFPFILQDKSNMIDDYLTECPSQVQPLLKFLDKLLDKRFKTMEFVHNYVQENNICQVKYEKLHYKPLGKLVARLCKKFNIPIETCENLSKNRTTGGLRYLIYQKYVGHNISSTVWDDLVKDSLRQYPDSAHAFIDMLVDYDKNEALKWAHLLNVPQNQLPLAIQGTHAPQMPIKKEEENWDTDVSSPSQLYLKSPLRRDQIIIIDSGDKFHNMINSDLKNHEVVSLDCEWKPSFGAKQSQVAIIQIGTNDKVYLIDSILLNNQEYQYLWHLFYKSFLDNAEIIKLGFGLEQDLREMKASIVGLGSIKVKGEGFLDLSTLWKSLLNHKINLPSGSDGGASLSCVAQACFGKPLAKSEQCSNWELRPLRESQIEYAALDAHILLQIYYYLQKKCKEQGIKFDDICNDVMIESKKKATKKPKEVEKIQKSFSQVFETKSADELKFIVEPMLYYLMSYLRYCGIDTIAAQVPNMLWHDIINFAISEDRYVLITKPKCSPTVKFPQTSILSVGKLPVLEQLHNIINTYKVHIEPTHILSICLNCNSKDMRNLNLDEIHHLCNQYEKAMLDAKGTRNAYDQDEEEDYYHNFISDSDDEHVPSFIPTNSSVNLSSNKMCKTSKGVDIDISNTELLRASQNNAILCENCGKVYFNNDDLLKSVSDTVFEVIKITHSLK